MAIQEDPCNLALTLGYGAIGDAVRMTKDELLGTWQIVSFKAVEGDKTSCPFGQHPSGYIGFSPARFWVMLADSTRKPPVAAALTDAEAVSLMRSSAAYTGKYDPDPVQTTDGLKITIHVDAASNQALVGTDRIFFMCVDDNKLILKSPSVVIPSGSMSVVQLEFVKAD
jgi:hypothetical protein